MEENQIELIDFLNIIWKRKWLIIIPTFILVLVVGVISFLLPSKWEVDAIIEPAKFLAKGVDGQYEEVLFANPKQISGQINKDTYTNLIVNELNLDITKFPKVKAENLEDTNLIRISTKEKDIEKAKKIFQSLFMQIKTDLDKKAKVESKEIDHTIKSTEVEKMRLEEEIGVIKKKLGVVNQRKKEIEKEMSDILERIKSLEKAQLSNLSKENRSESESLGMLLYSNEIQQSLKFHSELTELLSEKKIEEEDLNLEMENAEKQKEKLNSTIENLNQRKGRIDYTRLVKEPTSSVSPVSPKKKLNVVIAGVLSLVIFTILAFFLEYIKSKKIKEI